MVTSGWRLATGDEFIHTIALEALAEGPEGRLGDVGGDHLGRGNTMHQQAIAGAVRRTNKCTANSWGPLPPAVDLRNSIAGPAQIG
jgi:hypothetical protein